VIYFGYAIRHSRLASPAGARPITAWCESTKSRIDEFT